MQQFPIKIYILCITLMSAASNFVIAQDFYRNYERNILNRPHQKINYAVFNYSIKMMKDAFDQYERKTKHSILDRDTLFMVNYFDIETGEQIHVVWNRSSGFVYRYRYRQALIVEPDATDWIKDYKPEFKRWVETADTLAYDIYGKKSSWFDAPVISFTVATKINGHWSFISSGSHTNNIDRLN